MSSHKEASGEKPIYWSTRVLYSSPSCMAVRHGPTTVTRLNRYRTNPKAHTLNNISFPANRIVASYVTVFRLVDNHWCNNIQIVHIPNYKLYSLANSSRHSGTGTVLGRFVW